MATVIFYQPFDMSTFVAWAGDTINASSVQIVTSNGVQNQSFDGNFTYNSDYDLTGGTVTRTTYFVGGTGYGTTIYQASGLSLGVKTLMSYVMAYNADATHGYLLSGNDGFTGSSGNDVIKPYGGNDVVNGGLGSDTVVFRGVRAGYTITKWGDVEKTLTVAGADGSDTVKNIEYLRFDDQTLSVAALYASNAIEGGSGNDTLSGTAAADTIFGNNGNDRITGFAGNDTIDGGTGTDTAVFSGNLSAYTLTKTGSAYTIRDNTGIDGTDTLTNVERLQFTNKKVALDITDNALKTMQFIGVIAPALKPDLSIRGAVLSYFDQGRSMTEACQLALDAGWIPADNTELVKAAYRNVFQTLNGPDQGTINSLLPYVEQLGDAGFLAAVAGLNINVDLVGLQQSGMEYA